MHCQFAGFTQAHTFPGKLRQVPHAPVNSRASHVAGVFCGLLPPGVGRIAGTWFCIRNRRLASEPDLLKVNQDPWRGGHLT